MANTRFQLKRSTIGGVMPTTSDITTAELGLNVVDRKLFSSNGTSIFEIGSNLTSLSVGNTTTVQTLNSTGIYSTSVVNGATISVGTSFTANTTRLVLDTTIGLQANGGIGTAGQVLTSNATTVYWSTPTTGTVTSISTGNGLSGGPITSTGTVSVLANSGITANSTGTFVTQGTGMVVNATGIHVNATYIGTLSANNTTYLNGQLAAYYTNASNITTGTLPWAQAPTGTVNSSAAFTISGVYTYNANVIIGTTAGISANGTFGTAAQVLASNGTSVYWSTPAGTTLTANNTDTQTFYIPMANTTSGSWSNGVVSTTKLYFVPSTGTLNSTIFNSLSDARMKTDIENINYGLDTVLQLEPKTYKFIDNPNKQIGLIAQDVLKYIPESVAVGDDGKLSLNYDSLIAVIIEAIKQLNKKIDDK